MAFQLTDQLTDCRGVPFGSYRRQLPTSVANFPAAARVKDSELLKELHYEWCRCQVCGRAAGGNGGAWHLHLHHIIGGWRGRSDERTNLIMLCSDGPDQGCHAEAHGGALSLGRILYCKWRSDPNGVDWVRLAILRRSFLPDLEV